MYRMQFGMTNGNVSFMQNLLCNEKKSRACSGRMDEGNLNIFLDFSKIIESTS